MVLPDTPVETLLVVTPDQPVVNLYASLDTKVSIFSSEFAGVAIMSRKIEAARKPMGARRVAKEIALSDFGWSEKQYKCLNSLWTKESHWNYQARNPRSGAHGIAQALPATKMESVGTDWRTNPVTQIRWGLEYINSRYGSPCAAFSKWKRSRYY